MNVLWQSSRRRALSLVIGTAVVGLAFASPATSRVDPAPTVVSFNADSTPPDTTVSGGQSNPHSARFLLGASEATSGFECEVDVTGFVPCSSPYTVDHLAYGTHTIR